MNVKWLRIEGKKLATSKCYGLSPHSDSLRPLTATCPAQFRNAISAPKSLLYSLNGIECISIPILGSIFNRGRGHLQSVGQIQCWSTHAEHTIHLISSDSESDPIELKWLIALSTSKGGLRPLQPAIWAAAWCVVVQTENVRGTLPIVNGVLVKIVFTVTWKCGNYSFSQAHEIEIGHLQHRSIILTAATAKWPKLRVWIHVTALPSPLSLSFM